MSSLVCFFFGGGEDLYCDSNVLKIIVYREAYVLVRDAMWSFCLKAFSGSLCLGKVQAFFQCHTKPPCLLAHFYYLSFHYFMDWFPSLELAVELHASLPFPFALVLPFTWNIFTSWLWGLRRFQTWLRLLRASWTCPEYICTEISSLKFLPSGTANLKRWHSVIIYLYTLGS